MVNDRRRDDQTQIPRRPPLKDRQVQLMLGAMIRNPELYNELHGYLSPNEFSTAHRVYASLWATVLEYRSVHGVLPGEEALRADWDARLALLSPDEFSEVQLQNIDEWLDAIWIYDDESMAPTVVRQLLRTYLEDHWSLELAEAFSAVRNTPTECCAVLDRYRDMFATLASIDQAVGEDMMTVSAYELLEQEDQEQTWFVDDFLADPGYVDCTGNRIAILGGPLKSMKTLVMFDLAVSMATGTPFLGHFHVPKAVPVLVISAESGQDNLKKHVRRVAMARGIAAPEPDQPPSEEYLRLQHLHMFFRAPQLLDAKWVSWLRQRVIATGAAVVMIEPVYLSLLTAENSKLSSDLHAMGSILLRLSQIGDELGCLFLLGHHCGKAAAKERRNAPMLLADLHGAGVGEFASQWMLINHRVLYDDQDPTRHHLLWLRYGGRQGHAGLSALDVWEGPLNAPSWQTCVRTPTQLKEQIAADAATAEATAEQERRSAIIAAVAEAGSAIPGSRFRRLKVKGTQATIDASLAWLVASGALLEKTYRRGQNLHQQYQLRPAERVHVAICNGAPPRTGASAMKQRKSKTTKRRRKNCAPDT